MPTNDGKDSYGKLGMLLFIISFPLTVIFFIYVVMVNPGPIDTGVFEVPIQFSKANADERTTSWKEASAENIAYGEQLYKVDCASCHFQGNKDSVLEKTALKNGNTPLQMYKSIRHGFDGGHRFDYVPEREKWALIVYMRSKMQNPPDDSSSDWKKFMKEGMY